MIDNLINAIAWIISDSSTVETSSIGNEVIFCCEINYEYADDIRDAIDNLKNVCDINGIPLVIEYHNNGYFNVIFKKGE